MMTAFSQSETQLLQYIFSGIQFVFIHKTTSPDSFFAALGAADADAFGKISDEYLAVADITGMSSFGNCLNRRRSTKSSFTAISSLILVSRPPASFAPLYISVMAFLPALPQNTGNSHQIYSHGLQFSFNRIKFVRLDNSND
jgi:hypothetical protein